MSMIDKIELLPARLSEAGIMATMSRDLVEQGMHEWNWTHKRILKNLKHPEVAGVSAREGRNLAGFAIMHFSEEMAHLNLIAVNPSYQHCGLGRALMEWHEETARTAGIRRIDLEVRDTSISARRFYRRLGYREQRLIAGYYTNGESAVTMLKIL